MRKYLVLLPNNLGDVMMALPVLEALKHDKYNHITFFVEDGFEGGVHDCDFYDELLLFNRKNIKNSLRSEQWHEGIEYVQTFVNTLREHSFDVIVNLCQHTYIATLTGLLTAEKIVGRRLLKDGCHTIPDVWSRYLYAIPFARRYNKLHAIDVYKYIAGVSGIPARGLVAVPLQDLSTAKDFVRQDGKPDEMPLVLIHPGAAYLSKMWNVENYISLAHKLIDIGMWIVITGSETERSIAEGISQAVGCQCTVASGKFSFSQSRAFASIAEFCITGDTAMMHAASALNKKVFAFFGPTSPVETGPYGEGHTVFAGRCSTRPCFCFECKTKICMRSITPETVFEYITSGSVRSSSCDIYTTTFSDDATWTLVPVVEHGTPYYDNVRAEFIRKTFDPVFTCSERPDDTRQELVSEYEYIINCINSMEQHLSMYLVSREMQFIRMYELLRIGMGNRSGIAEFFTAILNIGLNGIALIDPIDAIKRSIETCRQLRQMIHEVIREV
jgi:ADP-heptose:LPS heptosyltransferase